VVCNRDGSASRAPELAPSLPMPAAELCGRLVTVEQVWGRPAIAELRDRLATADRTARDADAARGGANATAVRDRRPGAGPPYEQRHRGDQRRGGDRRPEGGSRCQQHSSGTAVQGAHRRRAEAAGPPDRSTGATSPVAQATSARPTSATSSGRSPGSRRPGTSKSGGGSGANIPATRWTAGRCRPVDFLHERQLTTG
jgi:hypothetical protein